MTISSENFRWAYTGDGSTTVFAYNNKIFSTDQLNVYLDGTLQTETTHYTVSGAGNENGGNVTFVTAPGSSIKVVILRNMDLLQGTDYPVGGSFPASATEDALDELTMIDQQQQEEIDRCLQTDVDDTYFEARGKRIKDGLGPIDDNDFATKTFVESQVANLLIDDIVAPIIKRYTTINTAVSDTTLEVGDVVLVKEYATGKGVINAVYDVVAAATGTNDGFQYHDTNGSLQLQLRVPYWVSVKLAGAYGDNTNDDTTAIMAAYNYVGANGGVLYIPDGQYYITDQGGTGIALEWDGGHSGLKVVMEGSFEYKDGTGIALRIGQGPNPITNSLFTGLTVNSTIQSPYENLAGFGIRLSEVGESTFSNCRVSGFREGYALRPNAVVSAVVGCIFNECSSTDCYYPLYIEPSELDICFVTNNTFYGGSHITPPGGFSDIVSANAHLISIHNPGRLTKSANTVDGNNFNSLKLEQRVTRRVYCEGNSNYFVGIYFDAGAYSIGGTHASGNYPYRQSNITGFTSDGSSTITKVAHGLGPYVRKGDLINVNALATNISDSGNYVVVDIDTDTVELNKPVTGVGSITIEHYSADIELAETGVNNVFDCGTIGLQAITSVATTQSNVIQNGRMGFVKGALPSAGTLGSDLFPGGLTDTPHPGLLSLWETTIGGAGTLNAFFGNRNDQDTNANVQLCFGGLDSSDRESIYASIEANKEGRGASQAYGGLIFRTRASGSNSYLVNRMSIDSNGVVSILDDHMIIQSAKTPSSASDTGTAGTVAWDSNYIYICVATDTWKRVAIATW